MKKISIIIPAFNEQTSIGQLLDSVERITYPKNSFEVIVVNDGSTDATAEVVKRYPSVILVNLNKNLGRYECRKKGAETAAYPNLFFIDAHSTIRPDVLSLLDRIDAKVINGRVENIEPLGAFDTFYFAIRRLIFPKFYKNIGPFYLTTENFNTMPKGTTVLYVEKEVLFSAYQELTNTIMDQHTSDDTKLLWTIVKREPILNHPDIKIKYISRSSIRASIKHLYERGPKFVDYYFNPTLRNFWLVIIFPLVALVAGIVALIWFPIGYISKIALLFGLNFLLTVVLARSIHEFIIIFVMTPVCGAIFYAGIIRGLWMKLVARRKI